MDERDKQSNETQKEKKPAEKVGLGHARKHQKMMDKTKKMWRGGGC